MATPQSRKHPGDSPREQFTSTPVVSKSIDATEEPVLILRRVHDVFSHNGAHYVNVAILKKSLGGQPERTVEAYQKETLTVKEFSNMRFEDTDSYKEITKEVEEKVAGLNSDEEEIQSKVEAPNGWSAGWLRPLFECLPFFSTSQETPNRPRRSSFTSAMKRSTKSADSFGNKINVHKVPKVQPDFNHHNEMIRTGKSAVSNTSILAHAAEPPSVLTPVSSRITTTRNHSQTKLTKLPGELDGSHHFTSFDPTPTCNLHLTGSSNVLLAANDEILGIEHLMATSMGVRVTKMLVRTGAQSYQILENIDFGLICSGREKRVEHLIGDHAYAHALYFHNERFTLPYPIYNGVPLEELLAEVDN